MNFWQGDDDSKNNAVIFCAVFQSQINAIAEKVGTSKKETEVSTVRLGFPKPNSFYLVLELEFYNCLRLFGTIYTPIIIICTLTQK